MYYLRWGNTQLGPYESHQILQMAEHGLVTELHEVVDSVTEHSMTVGCFRRDMLGGHDFSGGLPHPLNAEDLQRIHIEKLQAQHDEIQRLKAENDKFTETIKTITEAQHQHRAELSQQPPAWASALSDRQTEQFELQLKEARRMHEENQRIMWELRGTMNALPQAHAPAPSAIIISPTLPAPHHARTPLQQRLRETCHNIHAIAEPQPVTPCQAIVSRLDPNYGSKVAAAAIRELCKPKPINIYEGDQYTKSIWRYRFLGLFMGILGIHNFYAERYLSGFAQLLLTASCWWAGTPLLIMFLYNLGEIALIRTDGEGAQMQ
ncbi:MAG TPA: NINE protein [Candidatus Methylacidiphilales bacterium]|nr:NINE protein [Candidatus Methylacidiphilales bacterium]